MGTISSLTVNLPGSPVGVAYPCMTFSGPVAFCRRSELRTVTFPLEPSSSVVNET
ncbi:hypothetical protein DPMN_053693 [Dreissena polymorpha]|uniref:Uncharacterized protein n=1 Tax=Dreissena polymorpha TaxID=45954 RepID=A0A9D4HQY4_DREPO|nr:hypothetical protein DPMN_053693 [Dreissena polymorpha]